LLVDEFALNGPLRISIQLALGDIRGRAVIASGFRFLRQERECDGDNTQNNYFQDDSLLLHLSLLL
jgi:hypothetical protein